MIAMKIPAFKGRAGARDIGTSVAWFILGEAYMVVFFHPSNVAKEHALSA